MAGDEFDAGFEKVDVWLDGRRAVWTDMSREDMEETLILFEETRAAIARGDKDPKKMNPDGSTLDDEMEEAASALEYLGRRNKVRLERMESKARSLGLSL